MKHALFILFCLAGLARAGNEIGFVERFALAEDRAEALEEFIPGTPDYYFYHCLHYQHAGDRKLYDRLMEAWIKRHGHTGRVKMMQNRQALIDYDQQPKESLEHIVRRLGLSFDHRRQSEAEKAAYPVALDPKAVDAAAFRKQADQVKNTSGFTDAGLRSLAGQALNPTWRRHLLQRLQDPDFPGLTGHVLADLGEKNSGGFGSLGIHRLLTVKQLDGLAQAKPELLKQGAFVNEYLKRLQPRVGTDIMRDAKAREAYLNTLWTFVEPLEPVHNSLKAHVLFRRLLHDRDLGVYDAERFMTYLKLPRNAGYLNRDFERADSSRRYQANLGSRFDTRFPPVGNDQALVRAYLAHFLVKAADFRAYAPFVREDFLKDVFAETKIVTGAGNTEQWANLVSPSRYQEIVERVELDFLPTNQKFFAPNDPVSLVLNVKNVPSLIVKVFEINTFNYYREFGRELNVAVDLDGLVAANEQTHAYDLPPAKRTKRSFSFPQLKKRGVYVVDFIGNGKSSRALVIKGRLDYLERSTSAGHALTVLDEAGWPVRNAAVWMGDREYLPEKNGEILIPFSTHPGTHPIILRSGDFCSLDRLRHLGEDYQLHVGFHVDYEALLSGSTARLLVRPVCTAAGRPVSLKLLEEVELEITSRDGFGTDSTMVRRDFELFEDRESVVEFFVPERLQSLRFTLRAKVQNVSRNQRQDLAASRNIQLNGLRPSQQISQVLFTRSGADYFVAYHGRNGEPWPDQPLRLRVNHRWFNHHREISVKTGADGRCKLGALPDIASVQVTATGSGITQTLYPESDTLTFAHSLHALSGETLRIPVAPHTRTQDLSLIDAGWRSIENERLKLKDGFVELAGLAPGRYQLMVRSEGRRHQVEIAEGRREHGRLISGNRLLEATLERPLQITGLEADAKEVLLSVAHADEFTRVHIFASHFRPELDAFAALGHHGWPEAKSQFRSAPNSLYASGRNIGDEYRYILERQSAKQYPGNMLERPGLVLNPFSLRTTEEVDRELARDGKFEPQAPMAKPAPAPPRRPGVAGPGTERNGKRAPQGLQASLDFLAQPGLLFANLAPDAQGKIRIPRAALKGKQWIRAVALHPRQAVSRSLVLQEQPQQYFDDRLLTALDVRKPYTEQKLRSQVGKKKVFSVDEPGSTPFEVYDSLDKVYELFKALNPDEHLRRFEFVLRWPDLKPDEKQQKYSEFACHELHLFLYHKDRAFFDQVVAPYLANKKDPTFLDHWLLGAKLDRYLEPWHFNRLNIVERILLGERVERSASLAGYLQDRFDLIPYNPEEFEHRFDAALKSQALEAPVAKAGTATGGAASRWGVRANRLADRDGDGLVPVPSPEPKPGAAIASLAMPAPEMDAVRLTSTSGRRQLTEVMDELTKESGKKGGIKWERSRGEISLEEEREVLITDAKQAEYRFVEKFSKMKDKSKDFYDDLGRTRGRMRQLFRQLDATEEWAENNYYKLRIQQQLGSLVRENAFWNDYAKRDRKAPFTSPNLIYPTGNFSEMMLALSVLDLPFKPYEHLVKRDKKGLKLTAGGPVVVFHKEIREAEKAQEGLSLLVTQNYFRADDRYRQVGNERYDKFVDGDFLRRVLYGCQIVLTNPNPGEQKLNLLLQIPAGAIPVAQPWFTKGRDLRIAPYSTQKVEYFFYWPEAGQFAHYPVHVAKDEKVVATAKSRPLHVMEKLDERDIGSWAYLSQHGTDKEVQAYLATANLNRTPLALIAFRMKDRGFFTRTLKLLGSRHHYDHLLWSYGLYHGDAGAVREYLRHSPYANQVGASLSTKLLAVDPVERHRYEHLEYSPLVNARGHQVGREREILNQRFRSQYQGYMEVLSYQPKLTVMDWQAVCSYQLLQDRVEDGLNSFAKVDASLLHTQLQYDYLKAVVALYREDLAGARKLAERYEAHPVPKWQQKFQALLQQLDGEAEPVDKEDRNQQLEQLASTEPVLDFVMEGKRVVFTYENVKSCELRFYPMDVELLFSRKPFMSEGASRFGVIKPDLVRTVELPADQKRFSYELPAQYAKQNVMIEAQAGGLKASQAYYANAMDVQVVEAFGQVKVAEAGGKPLARTYVKVYAQLSNGQTKFWKDGYTDLRGRFDYVSLNTDRLGGAKRFALLVMDGEHGALIEEAEPPKK